MASHNKYGPRTGVVEAVIERAKRFTPQEARDLSDAWDATYNNPAWDAAHTAAWNAAGDVALDAAHTAARIAWENVYIAIAAEDTTADAAWNASYAAADAALAAAVAHLKDRQGFTRERLETLAGPWRQVIVDVDPLEGIGDD